MSRSEPKKPKKARAAPDADRRPRRDVALPDARTPRREFRPSNPERETVHVVLGRVDIGGTWAFTNITSEELAGLVSFLRSLETMTVREVFNQSKEPGKDYDVPDLPTPALDRLRELELEDTDRISRLRITGEQRLYGFREGARFYALWWDPHHTVYPSKKKHT